MDETFYSDGTLISPIKTVSKLSSFKVIGRLGYGSFSVVEKVQREDDNMIYAMKIVRMMNLSEKEKAAALNEVRILASFQSNHIVKYRESFYEKSSESLCIVMDFAGEDLSSKIKFIKNQENKELPNSSLNRIPEEQIWQYFIQGLKGLSELHSAGVLHRDIKSANLFVSEEGILKIGDFNVCKATPRTKPFQKIFQPDESEQQDQLMCVSQQTGTPYYTAPEVWADGNYSIASDIWSLGCVIFELCALYMPFQGSSLYDLAQNILNKPPRRLPQDCYSEELSQLIEKCLHKNSRERPTTHQLLKSSSIQKRLLEQSQHTDLLSSLSHNTPKKCHKHLQEHLNGIPNYLLDTIKFPSTLSKFSVILPANNYEEFNSIPIVSEFNNDILESVQNPQDEQDPVCDHQENKLIEIDDNNSQVSHEINGNSTPTKTNSRLFRQIESPEMQVSTNNPTRTNLNKNIINPRLMQEGNHNQRRTRYFIKLKQETSQELTNYCKKNNKIILPSKLQNTQLQDKNTQSYLNLKYPSEQTSQKINQIDNMNILCETIQNNSNLKQAGQITQNIPKTKTTTGLITRQVRFIRQPLQQTTAESGESLTPSLSPGSAGRSKNHSPEDSSKKRPSIASSYSPPRQFRISTTLSQVKNSPNRDQTKRHSQVSKFEQLFKRYLPNLYNNNLDKQQNFQNKDNSINNSIQQKVPSSPQHQIRNKSPYEGALKEVIYSQQTQYRTNRNQNISKNQLNNIEKRSKSNSSDQENKSQEGRKINNLNNLVLQVKPKKNNLNNNQTFIAPKKRSSMRINGLIQPMKNESIVRTVKCDQSIIGFKAQQNQYSSPQKKEDNMQLHQYHHYQLSERSCSPARKIQMNSHSEREIPSNKFHQKGNIYLQGVQKVVYPIIQQQQKYQIRRNSNEQNRSSSSSSKSSFIQ